MGLESNHTLEEIHAVLIQVLGMRGHGDTLPLGESRLEVRQFESLRPVVLVRSTLNLEDFENLINL